MQGIIQTDYQDGRVMYKTVHVTRHKSHTTGRAKVNIRGKMYRLTANYMKYLHPIHCTSTLVFPNGVGKVLDHLSRSVQQLGKRYIASLPTATENWHVTATEFARSCTDQDRHQVAVAMSHSMRMQARYYVAKGKDREGFKIIVGIHAGSGSAPKPYQKTAFTKDKITTISLYFEGHIKSGDAPSMPECRQFLADHPLERGAQQVRVPPYYLTE